MDSLLEHQLTKTRKFTSVLFIAWEFLASPNASKGSGLAGFELAAKGSEENSS